VKKVLKMGQSGKKPEKPVETSQNRLTKHAEKLKVNCGTVSSHPHEHWRFAPQ
jgi:hypothetical protein